MIPMISVSHLDEEKAKGETIDKAFSHLLVQLSVYRPAMDNHVLYKAKHLI